MPRPKNKKELIELSGKNYEKLKILIDSYPKDYLHTQFPSGYLNRNIRDVLAHLHHWHLMMLKWYEVGMAGDKPAMPAEGYTWKTTADLNKKIRDQYQEVDLHTIKSSLDSSFRELQSIIAKHSNDELFEKKRFKWTGSTSLGAYLISASSSHYDWAYKLIKKCI